MRRFFFQTAVVAVALVFFSMSFVSAGEAKEVNWDKFSKSLVKSLKSDNEGVRLPAMQLVIKSGDKVDVSNARYEVMDTFLKRLIINMGATPNQLVADFPQIEQPIALIQQKKQPRLFYLAALGLLGSLGILSAIFFK